MVPAKKRSRFDSADRSRAMRSRIRGVARRGGARPGQLPLERQVEAAAKLRRGLPRERDGRHVLDLVDTGGHASRHPLGEHLGLARSGAGFDEDVLEQLLANPTTRLPVDRARVTHAPRASRTPGTVRPPPFVQPAGSPAPRTPRRSRRYRQLSSSGVRMNCPVRITSRRSPSTAAIDAWVGAGILTRSWRPLWLEK